MDIGNKHIYTHAILQQLQTLQTGDKIRLNISNKNY